MIDLETLLAQLSAGPSDADRQAARARAAMAMGLGLLGTPGGRRNPWAGLAQGAAMGMGAYNDALAQARQRPLDRLKAAGTVVDYQSRGMDIKTKQAALDEAERQRQEAAMARDVLRGFRMPAPLPSMSPTNENAARLAATPKAGLFEKLNAQADALEAKGLVQQAQQYRTLAEKYAPQYEGTETLLRDGKPVVLQRFKNRAPEPMAGYQPKPDYKQVDTGGQIGFYDPLTGQAGGQFAKTATPDANLQARVAREGHAVTREGQLKPTWDPAAGQFVYPPSPSAPGGRAVQPTGFVQQEKPLTADQATSAMYLGMMNDATSNISKLVVPAGQISLARGDAPWVPAVVQNALSPEDAQKYVQSSLQWTEAMLRATTGATAPPEEVLRTSKTFFPQPFDKPGVVKQKNAARENMEKLMAVKAGKVGASQARAATAKPQGMSDDDLRKALGL